MTMMNHKTILLPNQMQCEYQYMRGAKSLQRCSKSAHYPALVRRWCWHHRRTGQASEKEAYLAAVRFDSKTECVHPSK